MLRERDFLILWFGQVVSIFGSRFSDLVIPLTILQITKSPINAALIAVSTQLAPLLISLPAGIWIENSSKKKIAQISELIRMLTMMILVIILLKNQFSILLVFFILFITGIAGMLFKISFNSLLPAIAGRKRLIEAHNYLESADAISTLLGPSLAGFCFTLIGAPATLGIDAFSFLISFISISSLKELDEEPNKSEQKLNLRQAFKQGLAGLQILFSSKIQSFITLNHTILNFTTSAISLLVIFYAKQKLDLSSSQIGILISGAGVGNIVGVLLMNRLKNIQWNKLYGCILMISGCGVILITVSSGMSLAFIGMFLFDGALSMAFVINGAARQTVTPDSFLARVGSGGILLTGIVVLFANGYAGIITELFNPTLALLVCAGLLLINSVISLVQKDLNRPISSFEN